MPAVNGPQYRKMAANCGGSQSDIPKDVACEFVHATPHAKRVMWSGKRKKGGKKAKLQMESV